MAKQTRSNTGRFTIFMLILFTMCVAAIVLSALSYKKTLDLEDSDNGDANTQNGNQQGQKGNLASSPSMVSPRMTAQRQTTPTPTSPATASPSATPPATTQLPIYDAVVDCDPHNANKARLNQSECESKGCEWHTPSNSRAPRCVYKSDVGYKVVNQTTVGDKLTVEIQSKGQSEVYGMPVHQRMTVEIDQYNENSLRIYFKPEKKTYEIPDAALKINTASRNANTPSQYTVEIVETPTFGIVVRRNATGAVVFNTSLPGLTFSDQFLQITTRLPSDNLYGFGEHNHRQFRLDMNWKTWPIFTRDCAPVDEWNLYGAHPVYMNLENDGNATMVFLKNSNAMDVTLQPSPFPAITYRVIGGVLDFYIFLGPTPQEAVQQYTEAVGRPAMPPYWALGFHMLRWGHKNLTQMKEVYERNMKAGIPIEAQWGDIDYMYEKFLFTLDKERFAGLPAFVDKIHDAKQKFVVIVDPGVGADPVKVQGAKNNSRGYNMLYDGIDKDIFIKRENGSLLYAKVWPGTVVFPDFTNENISMYWETWVNYFMNNESVKVDGLWIDMNEPASFVPGSTDGCVRNSWNYPPYVPPILGGQNGSLYDKTICMDAQQSWGKHYDVHSLYGHSNSIVTYNLLTKLSPNTRPFIMTRSSFSGTSKYASKWLGDNGSRWPHMHWSIVGLLEFSLFGFPLNGADICGFWDNTNYELCLRWFQLGAFYPFSRSHNMENMTAQDPAAFDAKFATTVRHLLLVRYKLLPYMYSLLKDAHVHGLTVMRPLMFEFPNDKKTWNIDRQFLLGPSFMVSPVLEQGNVTVDAYFPKGRWYSFYDGTEVDGGKVHTLDAPLDVINIHSRGGSIIPVQEPGNTTYYSRLNPMGLWVSLDENNNAKGSMYLDDGKSIDSYSTGNYTEVEFEVRLGESMDITVTHNGYTPPGNLTYGIIEFYGLVSFPGEMRINGERIESRHIRQKFQIIQLVDLNLDITKNHTLRWTIF